MKNFVKLAGTRCMAFLVTTILFSGLIMSTDWKFLMQ